MKGLAYWLNNRLYLSVTNRLNSVSPLALRGPSFVMPASSGFVPLASEPSAEDIVHAIDQAFDEGKIGISSMGSEEITFAGLGEPLLRSDVLLESALLIKEKRHGVQLRIRTNGLIMSSQTQELARNLKSAGFKLISVSLVSDNPKQYADIVKHVGPADFGDVCAFIMACSEAGKEFSSIGTIWLGLILSSLGLMVTCGAVARPDVKIARVRALSEALGAHSFREYAYFP
jgi:hypothetical protein